MKQQFPEHFDDGDIAHWSRWHPATHGSHKGWRVSRGYSPSEEHNGKSGRMILFRSYESAKRRADQLNLQNNPLDSLP